MTENTMYEVLSPWAEADPVPMDGLTAERVTDLNGKKIGMFCNIKQASNRIMPVVERRIKERYPDTEFSYFRGKAFSVSELEPDNIDNFNKWIDEVDTVILAVGDWGSCTKYLVYDSMYVERRNKPAVTLFYKYFVNDAKSAASSRGLPMIRLIPESIISECSIMDEIEAGVDEVFEDIIQGLTTPLTDEEKNPEPPRQENSARIIFKGTVGEVNRFFYQRGWTDGLPIIPPTEEAVAEMLTGTDLPPDHLVAVLEPRNGKATVEKIAVAAVMAGALPTYMPVLIAGTKALLNAPMADVWAVSTGGWAPLWVLNGRVRNDLNVNNSFGAFSPGLMANSAIGRALALITKNVRGVRREIEDMGVLGNPMKYCMVTGENEEDSPWEPLHVERGLSREDSAISLCFPNCYQQLHSYATDDLGVLRTIVYNIAPRAMGTITVVITPPHAKTLAERGWDKEKIKAYIMENAKTDLDRTPAYYTPGGEERDPKEQVPLVMGRPGQPAPIQIFVAGGWGSWTGLMSGGTPHTEKIELPANWDKLVAKYRNVVPTYIKY